MARTCERCGSKVPYSAKIDGKKRNLAKRKYCLTCSPFGEHNTKKLANYGEDGSKVCQDCQVIFVPNQGQSRCPSCWYKKNWRRRHDRLYALVGTACWVCGYNKGVEGTPVLDFHHMDAGDKEFSLSRREIASLAWDKVLKEAQKCALLCCRCHREFHAGLLEREKVEAVHREWWDRIGGIG